MLADVARRVTSGIFGGKFQLSVSGASSKVACSFLPNASVAYVKHLDHIVVDVVDEVQHTAITDNQMAYALPDIRILRCQRSESGQQVEPFDGSDNLQIPVQRILWRLFGYPAVSPFKIVFRCRLDFNAVFLLQRTMPCLDSNPSVNSRSGRPSSMACLMF